MPIDMGVGRLGDRRRDQPALSGRSDLHGFADDHVRSMTQNPHPSETGDERFECRGVPQLTRDRQFEVGCDVVGDRGHAAGIGLHPDLDQQEPTERLGLQRRDPLDQIMRERPCSGVGRGDHIRGLAGDERPQRVVGFVLRWAVHHEKRQLPIDVDAAVGWKLPSDLEALLDPARDRVEQRLVERWLPLCSHIRRRFLETVKRGSYCSAPPKASINPSTSAHARPRAATPGTERPGLSEPTMCYGHSPPE